MIQVFTIELIHYLSKTILFIYAKIIKHSILNTITLLIC